MKLKDVVKLSAIYLGREGVVNYLDSNGVGTYSGDVISDVDTLTRCANMVVSELACSYIPLKSKEVVVSEDGKVSFTDLTETALKIIGVYDENGEEVPYEIFPEYIKTDKSTVKVEYEYLPSNYGLTDNLGYTERQVPSRILAYGVTAEFCLTERSFEESVLWRKRYTDAVSQLTTLKSGKIRQRRFV